MVASVETSPSSPSGRPRTHSQSKQQQQQQQQQQQHTPATGPMPSRPTVLVAPAAPSLASASVATTASHPFDDDPDPLFLPLVRSATMPASLRASPAAVLAAKAAKAAAAAVGAGLESSPGLGGQAAFGGQGFGPGYGPGLGLGNGLALGGTTNGAANGTANGTANANGLANGPEHGFGHGSVGGANGLAAKNPPAFLSTVDSYGATPDNTFYTSVSPPPPPPPWDRPAHMLCDANSGVAAGGSGGSSGSSELRDSSRNTARQTLALRRPGSGLLLGGGIGGGSGGGSGGGGGGGGVHSSDLLRVSSAVLQGGRRGGSRSRSRRRPRRTWKKLLWVKQSYPDNYTDQATFLENLQRNPRLKPYEFWPLVADSTVIVQHVCSVILFVVCFIGIFQERVSPVAVVGGGSIATCLGWLLWESWASQEQAAEGSDGEGGPYGSVVGAGGDGPARYRGPPYSQNSAAASTGGVSADADSGTDVGIDAGTVNGQSPLRPVPLPPSTSAARQNRPPSPSLLSAGSSTTSLLTMSNKHGRNGHHKHNVSAGGRVGDRDSGAHRTTTVVHAPPASTQQPPTSNRQGRHGDPSLPLLPSTPATPATPRYPYPPPRRSQTLLVTRGGRAHHRVGTVKSAVLIYFTLLGLSPILKSLTRSTSSDSIWAISFWLLTINILFFDYSGVWVGAHKFPVASLSTNAALMASTVLASRLPSTGQVFSLTLFSIEVFGLFPVFRRYARHRSWRYHIGLTALLVLGAGAGVGIIASGSGDSNRLPWRGAVAGMVVSSVVSLLAMGGCSWWLIGLQKYKNEIYGPWDPARPIIISRRHWNDA